MTRLNSSIDIEVAKGLLELYVESGVVEPIGEEPINRFLLTPPKPTPEATAKTAEGR